MQPIVWSHFGGVFWYLGYLHSSKKAESPSRNNNCLGFLSVRAIRRLSYSVFQSAIDSSSVCGMNLLVEDRGLLDREDISQMEFFRTENAWSFVLFLGFVDSGLFASPLGLVFFPFLTPKFLNNIWAWNIELSIGLERMADLLETRQIKGHLDLVAQFLKGHVFLTFDNHFAIHIAVFKFDKILHKL